MHNLSATHDSTNRTIVRPTSSALLDPFRYALKLPPRSPCGFTPAKESTVVETVIDAEGDGIGPISISTACNHLFIYSVRYEHQNLGVMIVAGNCVQEAVADGRVRRGLEELHSKSLYLGPVMFHSLTTVVTPKSSRGLFASTVLHGGQTLLHENIALMGGDSTSPPPPLALLRLKLYGWLPFENSVPTCTIFGGAPALMMRIAWGQTPGSIEHARLA